MTKDQVLSKLKAERDGYVVGSATRNAYNTAIDLVESIHEDKTQATAEQLAERAQSQMATREEPKPKRKYTKRKPEVGRNKKPATKKAKGLLDVRYTRIAYLQGMPLEIANPLQIREVPMIIAIEDGQKVAYKCPTTKETKAWIATTRYAKAKGSLTEVLDMMEAGVEPPVKRKYVRKTKTND